MSWEDAILTARTPSSLELVRGVSQSVTAPLYRDGSAVAASAAVARLIDNAGTVRTSEASVPVPGGVPTWALTPDASWPLGVGWRIEWDVTHAGGIVRHQVAADLVRRAIYPVVTDLDLIRRDSTIDPAADGSRLPSSMTDLQDYIDEAWTEIRARIYGKGQRPALIMSPETLRSPHIYLAMSIIYRAMGADRLDLAAEYHALYEAAWGSIRWVYDQDDDGAPDEAGIRRAAVATVWTC